MKSETYIDYLEHVVLSLLQERDDEDTPVECIETRHPSYGEKSFSPHCIRKAIEVEQYSRQVNRYIKPRPAVHKCILKLIDDARLAAADAHRRAQADLAAAEAGKRVWDASNPEDGVGAPSMCPYHPKRVKETADNARFNHEFIDETYRYAIEVFIDE